MSKNKRKSLQLNRLRIMRRGTAAYDHTFHQGVNIIRGKNGSGKSTISDFIFFILGGEIDDWKDAASQCDEVQAEIDTANGILTLRRATNSSQSPIQIFFGSMEDASKQGLENWQQFPIRRRGGKESFSQVLFRSLLIPEAQSEGASNITMHQLLRLCYSDQRTPATRMFRFESFDTQSIREAVGDLVCGISGYEIYEIGLELRDLEKDLGIIKSKLSGLLKALPPDEALQTSMSIHSSITELQTEKVQLIKEIESADDQVNSSEVKQYMGERKNARSSLSKERKNIESLEESITSLDFEITEIEEFKIYLSELIDKLTLSEKAFESVGSLDFVYCPACGEELKNNVPKDHCIVCKNPTSKEKEMSRYNQIRLDLEIQTRETKQLLAQKQSEQAVDKQKLRPLLSLHEGTLTEYELKYSGSNGPRDAYLAERISRIGHINAEVVFLERSLGIAGEIDSLTSRQNSLQVDIDKKKQREAALQKQAQKRRSRALTLVSEKAVDLLHSDFKRQEEFENAKQVEINFINDAISVDKHLNFAESSNVFLKNAVIFSLFLAAGSDNEFYHPRFLLLDNIEDKGMEQERSHLFQELIVNRASELETPFQVIFTTSMMNPKLDKEDLVIGPAYTREQKTLDLFRKKPDQS